ncbi:MAG TPA: hypothetical protein VK149_03540 [Sideroxyarcus sp.]|nr:hypothetical protein [Sideroxyarcus sp.]
MRLFCLLVSIVMLGCTSTYPIINFTDQKIQRFDNRTLSSEEIHSAIRKAASDAGWRVQPGVSPNHIVATLNVRNSHKAIVDIVFGRDSYSIIYRDSENLVYARAAEDRGELRIHENYNKWVSELNDEIFRRLQE